MAFYDFQCGCGNVFNVRASVAQMENKEIACPDCGSKEISRVYSAFNFISSGASAANSRGRELPECPHAHICGEHCRH